MNHAQNPSAPAASSTRFLTDTDLTALASWPDAVATLRRAYAAQVDPQSVPPRTMARIPGSWLRSLTAISPLMRHLGCKLIAASPRLRRASYLVALFDPETMELASLQDGNQITGIRTAATASVAVDALAPRKPLKVGVLGSGFEARAQLEALAATREISGVGVFSPTAARCEDFAKVLGQRLGLAIQAMEQPQRAVAGADVVICAARARGEIPILKSEWLEPGMTIVSVGSTLQEQREVDSGVIARVETIIADVPDEVAHETGDMIAAKAAGIDFAGKLIPLVDLIGGRHPGRRRAEDIVLYKSVGSALQDVVIAEMLHLQARNRGLGVMLPVSITPVAK